MTTLNTYMVWPDCLQMTPLIKHVLITDLIKLKDKAKKKLIIFTSIENRSNGDYSST